MTTEAPEALQAIEGPEAAGAWPAPRLADPASASPDAGDVDIDVHSDVDDDVRSSDGVGSYDGVDDPDREPGTSVALFEGDEGGLELAQRRALVAVVKERFITATSHPKEWRALLANPRLVRSRLNDLFLDLYLDVDRQVAFKRQAAPEGGGRFPTLLHDTTWSREETILLVFLRARSRADEAAGVPRTFVDRVDMLEHAASMRPPHATDQARDTRRATKAIENLITAGLLTGASTADRFEVSRAVDVVLPLERLTALLEWLDSENATTDADSADAKHDPGDSGSEDAAAHSRTDQATFAEEQS